MKLLNKLKLLLLILVIIIFNNILINNINRYKIPPNYSHIKVLYPKNINSLKDMLKYNNSVFSSGYSYTLNKKIEKNNSIHICCKNLKKIRLLKNNLVEIEPGVTFGELQNFLSKHKRSIADFPVFDEIGVISSIITKGHGCFEKHFIFDVQKIEVFDHKNNSTYIINDSNIITKLDSNSNKTILSAVLNTEKETLYRINVEKIKKIPINIQKNTEYFFSKQTIYKRYYELIEDNDNYKLESYKTYNFLNKYGRLFGYNYPGYVNNKIFKSTELFLFDSYLLIDRIFGPSVINFEFCITTINYNKYYDSFINLFNSLININEFRVDIRSQKNIIWIDILFSDKEDFFNINKKFLELLEGNEIYYYLHEGKYILDKTPYQTSFYSITK